MSTHRSLSFEDVLPRLVSTYESGRLVPFIGAGMSVPTCTSWLEFVQKIECAAKPDFKEPWNESPDSADIIRRANSAVRCLKSQSDANAQGDTPLVTAIRSALSNGTQKVPDQTMALAKLWWPLVLSTNYDSCFASAFEEHHSARQLEIVGRSPADCQRALNALTAPGVSLLWALQGFLGAPCDTTKAIVHGKLHLELVVGHEEYRRVTYRDLHFRRAFAEVFRSRSLLFLGSGIRETYLQELFGEVLEMYGQSARPHYAFMREDEVRDPEFLLSRFQIHVVPYDQHKTLPEWLDRFATAVRGAGRRVATWTYGRPASESSADEWRHEPELEVVRGPLPTPHAEDECLALSAGGHPGTYFIGERIAALLKSLGITVTQVGSQHQVVPPQSHGQYLGWFPEHRIVLVRARSADDERGLVHVRNASIELFDFAAARYKRACMQLLAAGGSEQDTSESWRQRSFPERYSFIQIVRAYGDWLRRRDRKDFRLALHVIVPQVHMEIASGRLDVLELLACGDIRFWAEVIAGDQVERRLFQELPTMTLRDIADALDIDVRGWVFAVRPAPSLSKLDQADQTVASRSTCTLDELGVVPGSTVHFKRNDAQR